MINVMSPPSQACEALPGALTAGSFRRTVDRALVHRTALGEVFLTDLVQIDDTEYVAAGQLPRSHAYYGDHTHCGVSYDPVLLLEASRQAGLAIAHCFFDVPADHKFILTRLDIRVDPSAVPVAGHRPGELVARVRITDRRIRDGRLTGLDYHFELSELSTGPIGSATLGLRFRSPRSYLELRLGNRGGAELPSSATFRPTLSGLATEPAMVGRRDPRNVIVTAPTPVDGVVVSDMRLPAGHPSMFDHPQDHVPGMVLIEAARQLAIAGTTDRYGFAPTKIQVCEITSEFVKFAELEPTTRLIALVGAIIPPAAQSTRRAERHTVYTQAGPLEVEHDLDRTNDDRTMLPVVVEQFQDNDLVCRVTTMLSVLPTMVREV